MFQNKPLCKLNGCNRPCFFDKSTNSFFDFCGRRHRDESESKSKGSSIGNIFSSVVSTFKPSSTPLPNRNQSSSNKLCKNPKCNQKCFIEANGKVHEFCGRTCALSYTSNHNNPSQPSSSSSLLKSSNQCLFPKDTIIVIANQSDHIDQIKRSLSQEIQHISKYGVRTGFALTKSASKNLQSVDQLLQNNSSRILAIFEHSKTTAKDRLDKSKLSAPLYTVPKLFIFDNNSHFQQTVEQVVLPRMVKKIHFYHAVEPFYEFTNFYAASIRVGVYEDKGTVLEWRTSEHYFQAMKYSKSGNEHLMKQVQECKTPREAFDFARKNRKCIRSDWDDIKEDVMERALYAKFTQHKNLKQLLLITGEAALVEHTKNDSYWGDNGDGTGSNRLGYLLVKVRGTIQRESSSLTHSSTKSPTRMKRNERTHQRRKFSPY